MPDAFIALLSALIGGTGIKVVEHFLSKKTVQDNTAAELRAELRDDLTTIRSEMRSVEIELSDWRDRYYKLLERFIEIKASIEDGEPVDKPRP